ncbi:toll/interleukin-1 receptor domain-containing protein [Leucothrix pacifica]|uniref:Uncharacterized protein n=1 Tax=Leucothrix pacifica TaxID=1247513 RepID=A0A317CKK7_9GAMM|nr:toll/interleukin-1 receptor domain-containing protein [Leucothrix pacifica]PWQ96872.1 hypothetical protein DKW60_11730 [Leucothrix pacifica]
MSKVFISYSHDSDTHREQVLALSNHLRGDGVDCWIDQYEPAPPEGWPRKMDRGIREADFVLMVCTEIYLKRLQLEEEEGKGLGVAWEGSLIYNTLYRDRTLNHKFIPVLFSSDDKAFIPTILFGNSHYDLSLPRGYDHLYRHLRGELGETMPPLGKKRFVRTIHSDALPTVEGELFGRKDELALLDEALLDADTHVVQFVASGGTGKTKLLRHWLDDNHDKIEALIAWSFYSQGSSEDKQISATPFFIQALKSLRADKDISDFNTEEEKGEYIADLLRERRCLLVLDGLEPLQQVGRGMRGELKDRAIRKMLRCLMGDHSSLCIITTRLPVRELKGRRRVVQHDLQNLAPEDGVALLRSFTEPYPVHGRDVDMLAAVEEYGRHALALHLLGNALATYLDGDVRKRDTLGELIGDYDDVERHAFKVMQAYEQWLEGTVELKLLYLLGLFDHPVEQDVLEVLWEAGIPGLTEGVDKKAWLVARRDLLGKFQMMSEHEGRDDLFDCHPLIREYFGRQLQENEGEAWRQAHTVLYEYYKGLPEKLWGKYLPDTLEEMQPLFRAVVHGCLAGDMSESFHEIYFMRIERGTKIYLKNQPTERLQLLSLFFEVAWSQFSSKLDPATSSVIAEWSGMELWRLGRPRESIPLLTSRLDFGYKHQNHDIIVGITTNLVEIYNCLGFLKKAISLANAFDSYLGGIKYEIDFKNITALCSKAETLHKLGKHKESQALFEAASGIQANREGKDRPKELLSFQGFQYCQLLIDLRQYEEAYSLSKSIISIASNHRDHNDACLGAICAGAILTRAPYGNRRAAIEQLNFSIDTFKLLDQSHDWWPYALIYRSEYFRCDFNYEAAKNDLLETYEIAEPSGMRLHLTDYHLEMARLILAIEADPDQYKEATPDREQRTLPTELADPDEPGILTLEGHIQAADKLIQDTGYHRRDAELAELKQQAGMSC